MVKKIRTYSEEFKAEAVKKISDNNGNISATAKQLGIAMQTLSNWNCGMCNIGDTNILGVAKDDDSLSYPVVEITKLMREETNLSEDFIVLSYEVGEYLTLYKISKTQELEDSTIYGVEVEYDDLGKLVIGNPKKIFSSFEEYFMDFLELGS